MMVTTRKAYPQESQRIAAFYRDNDYRPAIGPADVVAVAESEGTLCGAVRICDEHGVLVLRGMRVREDVRRQGIGTRLLQTVEPVIGDRECFCIPHRYLRSFYGRIGFVEIDAIEAPPFLRQRCARYRREYGLDVIVMRKGLLLSPVIPSDRRESRNLLSESHLPLQVEIPRFATLTRNDAPGEPE